MPLRWWGSRVGRASGGPGQGRLAKDLRAAAVDEVTTGERAHAQRACAQRVRVQRDERDRVAHGQKPLVKRLLFYARTGANSRTVHQTE